MLRHAELFNPIKMTEQMKTENFMKYVEIREKQSGPTETKLVTELKDRFFDAHYRIDEDKLNDVWGKLAAKFEENTGLTQFALDWHGAESKFFFPWLISVFTSPSLALEMSYGLGPDLTGETTKVPESDPIDFFVKNDPTFMYNRERQLFVADLAVSAREAPRPNYNERCKVVDCGAGRIAWARRHGFIFKPHEQVIMAFDKDPSVALGRILPLGFGVTYRTGNLASELRSADYDNANLFIMGGLASYLHHEMLEKATKLIYKHLEDNGVFFFDLQLDCPYYRRSMAIFYWPKIKLAKSAEAAIGTVEQLRKKLWKEGMRFSAEYALDTYNEHPSSVMVTFTKI